MAVCVLCFVYIGSWSFVVTIALLLFCWIPESVRNFMTKFQNFSQSFGLVENQFNRLCKTTHGQPPILACSVSNLLWRALSCPKEPVGCL